MLDRRAALRAGTLFLAVVALAAAVAAWTYVDRAAHLARSTALIAAQTSTFLTVWIDARLAAVGALAERRADAYADAADAFHDADAFGEAAAGLLERWPGLRALNWVDGDGVIRVVMPVAGNEAALGSRLYDHPATHVVEAVRKAAAGNAPTRTASVSLIQGGRGFAFYWPMRRPDGSLAGFLNGVVDVDRLVANSDVLANLGQDHWLELRDPDGTITWSNTDLPAGAWRLASEQHMFILGLDWVLTLAPTPGRIAAVVGGRELAIWVAGSGLLAALLALALWRRWLVEARGRRRGQILRDLVDRLPHPVFLVDADGRFRFVNEALAALCGVDRSVLLGAGPERLPSTPEEVADFVGANARALAASGPEAREETLTDAGGRQRLLEMVRTPYTDPVDQTPAVLGIGVDVTGRQDQQRLRARIATALDQAGEAIAVLDRHGRIEFANSAFSQMMGVGERDVRGLGAEAFAVPGSDDDSLIAEIAATLRSGQSWRRRYTSRWADGDRVRDATVSPFRDESGRVAGYVGVIRDATREQQLETELRQAQKLEAVGRLSGGIAHDFNNLLTVILGFAEMLRDDVAPDSRSAAAVAEIGKAAGRAAELTRKLLTFSRRSGDGGVAELNPVVAGLVPMLDRLLGDRVAMVLELAEDVGRVAAAAGEVEQIIVNLCLNARDAMPDGGRIVVRTSLRDAAVAPPAVQTRLAPGRHAVLEVQDEGVGMAAEVEQHIFEPFFTTKDVGAGSGLGLSIVYGIVEQRRGAIEVRTVPGAGTTMAVWLPEATADA
ncbi:MAG: PAS domain-containing protein [bacterium]